MLVPLRILAVVLAASVTAPVGAAEPQPGAVRINLVDGAEMVWIPAGEFLMGTDPEELDQQWERHGWYPANMRYRTNETPAHRVRLSGFWMYRTEVTNAQFARFVETTGYVTDAENLTEPGTRSWRDPLYDDRSLSELSDHPV